MKNPDSKKIGYMIVVVSSYRWKMLEFYYKLICPLCDVRKIPYLSDFMFANHKMVTTLMLDKLNTAL